MAVCEGRQDAVLHVLLCTCATAWTYSVSHQRLRPHQQQQQQHSYRARGLLGTGGAVDRPAQGSILAVQPALMVVA